MSKEPKYKFLTKREFFSAMEKGRYSHVADGVLEVVSNFNPYEVIGIKVVTGSKLKVLEAFKLDEEKYIKLTSLAEMAG